jgi:hypothetical protein
MFLRIVEMLDFNWCCYVNTINNSSILVVTVELGGARGSVVVKALGYKPQGHGFESRLGEI